MLPKPSHLSAEFGEQFGDPQVAEAYVHRPAYSDDVLAVLRKLLSRQSRVVLDLGCGTGEIARRWVGDVDRIDVVDASDAMIAAGKASPNGRHANLHWFRCSAEEFTDPRKYDLVVAAESFHWFDWDAVVPCIRNALAEQGRLVLVDRESPNVPWHNDLTRLIARCSTNREYQPYDLVTELHERGLFEAQSSTVTRPVDVRQSVEDYVESFHSRNGLTRARLGPRRASEFDRELNRVLTPHVRAGCIDFSFVISLTWGRPTSSE